MESQELDPDRSARLSGARAEFIASLGRRLEALRGALSGLEQESRSKSRRDNLMRRVHAMGAAARVLGFAAVAEALSAAESALQRSAGAREVPAGDLAEVSRAFDQLPSLVWGIASSAPPAPEGPAAGEQRSWPLSVLVFGSAALAEGLIEMGAGSPIETERTEELERARELARTVGPDIVVLDVDRRGARELAEGVLNDPLMEPAPLIVVGTFDTPESAADLVALGATRVLPKPVSPDTLRQSVVQASQMLSQRRGLREPLGEISVEGLAERIGAEVRRGLVEALEPLAREAKVALGEGTDVLGAVWASVARVRELVTLRSGGTVRFDAAGPEGAIPLAPWAGADRGAGERGTRDARDADRVSLEGRTALVADDDPAVVWFIGGLLRAVGTQPIEAHDGRRALELAYETWPDLVVSDLLMPGLDGFSLCREIKRDVAIRDVPVIVLSWKEDLLQRMRELGADADGYLRKEASASTVVRRVREVLRPRARVEARLKSGGEVRGRLDGLTPRLVLQLTCAHQPDARVSFRDAVYLYEVQVRQGRPRCATRTASDGSFERGEGVLGALLGASAGRFVVTPDHSPCRDDFEGPLEQVLKGPIERARAAQHALSAERFVRVERVEIDETAVLAYVASTPEPARSVVQRLLQGAAPRELVVSGEVSPRLLDLVLGDIARHGGVLAVEGAEGADLLARAAAELTQAPVRSVAPSPPRVAEPQFTLQLSPAPADVREVSAAVGVPVVMTFGPPPTPEPPREDVPPVETLVGTASPVPVGVSSSAPAVLPLSRAVTPFVPTQEPPGVLGEAGWSGVEPSTLPGMGGEVASPAAKAESEAPEAESEPAIKVESGAAPEAGSEPAPEAGSEPAPEAGSEPAPEAGSEPAPEAGSEPERAESLPVGHDASRPDDERADAFAATLNASRREIEELPLPSRMRVSARPSAPALDAERGGVDLDRAVLDALEESWTPSRPGTAVAPGRATEEGTGADEPLVPPPDAVEQAAAALLAKVTELPRSRDRDPGSVSDFRSPDPPEHDLAARPKTQTLRMEAPAAKSDPVASPPVGSAPPPLVPSDVPRGILEPSKALETRDQNSAASRARSLEQPAKPSFEPPKEPGAKATGPRPGSEESSGWSVVRMVLLAIAAGVASFAIVSWLKPPDARTLAAAPSASAAAVAVPASSAARAPEAPLIEDLELPLGVQLAEGKGLLEIETFAKQAIYVDNVFVGRGPLRRIPLDPGRHDVKLRLDADEIVQGVEIRRGRRTRLSLSPSP